MTRAPRLVLTASLSALALGLSACASADTSSATGGQGGGDDIVIT